VGVIVKIENETFSVLNQFGNLVKLRSQQIMRKLDSKKALTSDVNGRTIGAGDMVLATDGSTGSVRRGTVIHIYRSSVFVLSREVIENGGIFVTKSGNISLLSGGRGGAVSSHLGVELLLL
jgi:transcription elongation factor SPT5